MKYYVEGETFDNAYDVACYINTEGDYDEDMFDEELDEVYGSIEICGTRIFPSDALKQCDNRGYRNAFEDWCSNRVSDDRADTANQVEGMAPGETLYINGYDIEAMLDEEEELTEEVAAEVPQDDFELIDVTMGGDIDEEDIAAILEGFSSGQ